MDLDWAVWGPPLAVFAVGVAFGVWTSMRLVAAEDASIKRETRRIDLESTRDEVVDALKQLELDRDKMDAAAWQREREELLARGAGAMRALDQDGQLIEAPAPEPAAVTPAAPAAPPMIAPEWKGALYTLAALGVGFFLYNAVTQETSDRREGGTMTGNQVGAAEEDPTAAFRNSPEFQERERALLTRIEANEKDIEALNDLTLLYINAGDPQKAFQNNEKALKADEKDKEGRTLRGVLTAMMGMEDRAFQLLDEVIAEDPDYTMALMFRSRLYVLSGRPNEAISTLEAALQRKPDNSDLAAFLAQTRQIVAQMGPPPAAAGGELLAGGKIEVDPAVAAQLKGNETLFLSVANPAQPRPPVAADKRAGPFTFPLPFELTTAHIRGMPGAGGVPEVLDLKARFDGDGDPITVEANLPRITVTGVKKGTGGMTLRLSLSDAPVPAASAGGEVQKSALLAPAAPPPPAGGGGGAVLAAGTATIDPARAGEISGSETVFVSVGDPAGGPPYAATKLPAKFPLAFRLTTDNVIPMMAGRPLPDTFLVSVRVDEDGNATTKAGEPEIRQPGVRKGTDNLQLTLK